MGNKFFIKKNFLHPISEYMVTDVKTISVNDSIGKAAEIFSENRFGSLPILNEQGALQAIISEKDIVLKIDFNDKNWRNLKAIDFATLKVLSLYKDNTILDALELMAIREIRHIPIVKTDNTLSGIFSSRDLLEYIKLNFTKYLEDRGTKVHWKSYDVDDLLGDLSLSQENTFSDTYTFFNTTLRNFTLSRPMIVDSKDPISNVLSGIRKLKQSIIFVCEFTSVLKGVITERDIVKNYLAHNPDPNAPISSIATKHPLTLLKKHPIAFAINNMLEFGNRNIIIVNEDNYPLGNLSIIDILRFMHEKIE
ncbi:MAG: CBS domain-containing protein [Halobacteriovoraceae bacterium]|nr:CBS domain-containing protein [Halobacteriovoraceae bacterium]